MVVKKTYIKIIVREIKESFGRFVAIFGIVALGVGFLSGLLVTTPDLYHSIDEYYDKNNMADIFIKATMGLTEDDIEKVSSLENIEELMPAYVTDVLMETSNNEVLATRVYGLPLIGDKKANINRLQLIEGRMPQNKYECIVERGGHYLTDIKLGSKLIISSENEDYEDIRDTYAALEYTVVGIVSNSFHFSREIEVTNIGNGRLGSIMYVDEESYALDVFTDFYITATGAKALDSFSAEYENHMEDVVESLEELGEERSVIRYNEVLKEAEYELADGWQEYEEGKLEAETELADALKEIEDGKIELADGLKELNDGRKELADAKITLKEETEKAQIEIEDAKVELSDALLELQDGDKELKDAWIELQDGLKEYQDGYIEYLDAKKELEDGQKEFDEGEQEYLEAVKKLEDGKREIRRGERELASAREQLESAEEEIEAGTRELKQQKEMFISQVEPIATQFGYPSVEAMFEDPSIGEKLALIPDGSTLIDGWSAIKEGEAKLEYGAYEIADGWEQYEDGREELRDGKKELEDAEEKLGDAKKTLEKNRKKLEDGWTELEDGRIELVDARIKLEDGFKEYEDGKKELEDGWVKYYDGIKELEDAEKTLAEEIEKANKEIRDAEIDIAEGQADYDEGIIELADGEKEYYEAKADAEKELRDAELELLDGEKEIADLEVPEWYVLDRNSNMSYVSFEMNADKVAAVSKVFPIFFYLVAALVALTTMTRMVAEERIQIGTLKALGYKKSSIMFKYLVYCGLASILGAIGGQLVGFNLIPKVIWNAYGTMYHLPEFIVQYNKKISLISAGLAILSTMAATIYACYEALREKPATLMLPRAPKAGKRIMLERVTPIWSRMSFNHKATARNIFRYKKHFFMTVIGIAGCTGLLVTGFGIRDSIGQLANTQFLNIFNYDIELELDEGNIDAALMEILEDKSLIDDYIGLYSDKGKIIFNNKKLDSTIMATESSESFSRFISFRNRKTGEEIGFDENSVIITEKLSEVLGLRIGDEFEYMNSDDNRAKFKVTGITENYLGNYLYLNMKEYEEAFDFDFKNNKIMSKTPVTDSKEQDDLITRLLSNEYILNAEFITQQKTTFDNLLGSMNYIVVVIILASGMLAFIVLYNLTNININERRKELATLKVLGFHNEEVSAYIYRETSILTLVGIITGLFLGTLLHRFIVATIENPDVMFGRKIDFKSYIYSAIITVIFSVIVNLFMSKKLRNIKMVDSMKAND